MTPEINNHLSAGQTMRKRQIVLGNFLGGLAWGIGSVLGATVVIALLVGFLRTINFVPVVGNFAEQVVDQVQTRQMEKK